MIKYYINWNEIVIFRNKVLLLFSIIICYKINGFLILIKVVFLKVIFWIPLGSNSPKVRVNFNCYACIIAYFVSLWIHNRVYKKQLCEVSCFNSCEAICSYFLYLLEFWYRVFYSIVPWLFNQLASFRSYYCYRF